MLEKEMYPADACSPGLNEGSVAVNVLEETTESERNKVVKGCRKLKSSLVRRSLILLGQGGLRNSRGANHRP